MSTLIWLILITAFMFFMHRGHGSGGMGCCGGGHTHGSHNRNTSANQEEQYRSRAELSAMKEADYELLEEQPEDQTSRATKINHRHHPEAKHEVHKV